MGLFKNNSNAEDMFEVNSTKPIYKYYMEVIGGSKELYTIKAHDMDVSSYGCYTFILDNKIIAWYPINRTIIKSIEEKQDA